MAVTKILARHAGLKDSIKYVLNGDKTNERILTAFQNCSEENAYAEMTQTKHNCHNTGGVVSYHIIQSFSPSEASPELALEIAKQFAAEHLNGYEAVIGVHVDKEHTHAHIVFNSVNMLTSKKYHSNAKTYYKQIRGISDRLCAEHGLSVIMHAEHGRGMNYAEWLRIKKGQPTMRTMLMADLEQAIGQAAGYGNFLMLMEHMGYEVKQGARLSFRLRGSEQFIVPGRKNARYTEAGIRQVIESGLTATQENMRSTYVSPKKYTPFHPTGKLKGFWGLYTHYLYLLGKIGKQEYPPRITLAQKQAVLQFEMYREKFKFLNKYRLETWEQLSHFLEDAKVREAVLVKNRIILNVRKKKLKPLFDALADSELLKPAKELYDSGMTGMEDEYARYRSAEQILQKSNVPRPQLLKDKAELYGELADIHSELWNLKKEMRLCNEIMDEAPRLEKELKRTEKTKENEVIKDVKRRRRG